MEINIEKCFGCRYKGEQIYNHFVNKYTAIWCLHFLCVGKVGVTGRLSSKDCPFYEDAPQNTMVVKNSSYNSHMANVVCKFSLFEFISNWLRRPRLCRPPVGDDLWDTGVVEFNPLQSSIAFNISEHEGMLTTL